MSVLLKRTKLEIRIQLPTHACESFQHLDILWAWNVLEILTKGRGRDSWGVRNAEKQSLPCLTRLPGWGWAALFFFFSCLLGLDFSVQLSCCSLMLGFCSFNKQAISSDILTPLALKKKLKISLKKVTAVKNVQKYFRL